MQVPGQVVVLDHALPQDLADAILDHALASEADFVPSRIVRYGARTNTPRVRQSLHCKTGLGPHEDAYCAVVLDHLPALLRGTGIKPFAPLELDIELVAHRDNHFFARHVDTLTGADSRAQAWVRMLSSVTYLHRFPRRFSGGSIVLGSIMGDAEVAIEPAHNRMVAFPSFDPHEVLPVSVPGDAFADARFSINCWFNKRIAGREPAAD